MTKLFYENIETKIGTLAITASEKGVREISWKKSKTQNENALTNKAAIQLSEYFAGKRKSFELPLDLAGTEFQKSAWKALQKIPYGKTISYQQQATSIGDAKKARAVGMANSRNPIPIIIPCHRVIGKNGKLTGYAGGMNKKSLLLELEKKSS